MNYHLAITQGLSVSCLCFCIKEGGSFCFCCTLKFPLNLRAKLAGVLPEVENDSRVCVCRLSLLILRNAHKMRTGSVTVEMQSVVSGAACLALDPAEAPCDQSPVAPSSTLCVCSGVLKRSGNTPLSSSIYITASLRPYLLPIMCRAQ